MSAWAMPRAAGPALAVDRSSMWAGLLSLLVHGGLVLALVLGVSWRNTPNQPAQAELWTHLPEPAVMTQPEPMVEPPPKAPPKLESRPVHKPDITLKSKPEPKPAKKPLPAKVEPKKREAQETQKRELNKRELNKREVARRALEQELASEAKEAMTAELAQVQALRQRAEAKAQTAAQLKSMAIRDAQDRIRLKIRGLLRIPEGIKGNPEVVYLVRLFPNGEIMGMPERIQSSGQPAYDAAVEAAILKASPLPLPTGAGVAADFRGGLELRFRPREG